VVDSSWQLDLDFLFSDFLELVGFNLVVKRKFDNFSVIDVVVSLCVVLENCRVTCDDLELVVIRRCLAG
jgi:hypothetical protein